MAFPFLGGRVKPFDVTRRLATGLGLERLVQETTSPRSQLRTGHTLYTEAAGLWTEAAALIKKAGDSGNAQCYATAGSLLGDLSRMEREAMQALSCLGSETPA